MSIVYNKTHTVTFTKLKESDLSPLQQKDSWEDFYMVPSSRPYIVVPNPRIQFVNLPRSNTILDTTDFLTKNTTYEAREGDLEFIIDHDRWDNWSESFDALSEFFDGSIFHCVLNDQPDYKYTGRIYVLNYKPDSNYSTVTLHYNFDAECEECTWNEVLFERCQNGNVVNADGMSFETFRITDPIGKNGGTYRFYVKEFVNTVMNHKYYLLREMYRDSGYTDLVARVSFKINDKLNGEWKYIHGEPFLYGGGIIDTYDFTRSEYDDRYIRYLIGMLYNGDAYTTKFYIEKQNTTKIIY